MFERLTDSARQAVVKSQSIARRRDDHRIGPVHLLLGAREDNPKIEQVLDSFGLDGEVLSGLLDGHDDDLGLGLLGVDPQLVTQTADQTFGEGAFGRADSSQSPRFTLRRRSKRSILFTNGAKRCLEQSLRVSLARNEQFVCDAHVASGAVSTREGALAIHLAVTGIDVAQLQKELGDCATTNHATTN